MTEHLDLYESLRRINPVDESGVVDAASSAQAEQTLRRILASPPAMPRRRLPIRIPGSRRRRLYVLAAIALAAALATTAWALTRRPTRELTIGCYGAAQLDARVVVVAATDAPATATCREVWSRGDFGHQRVPKLEACVLPSGGIAVFPSPNGTACRGLELVPLASPRQPGTTTARATVTELRDVLVKMFLARACMPDHDATAAVRDKLRRLGLSDWGVRTNGAFNDSRPCASLAFDEEHKLVLLIPMPRRP